MVDPDLSKQSRMEIQYAIEVIASFLQNSVKDTGSFGFEGLVALLLEQATGQEVRLASAGRQSGRDAATESGYGNNIKVEAKHYRESTPLRPRELIAELEEAIRSDPDLDIWLLAASRSVSEQIATSLEQIAGTRGVDVIILDYGIDGLPRLAVLMAVFQEVVVSWAKRGNLEYDELALRVALTTISGTPEFESASDRLMAKLHAAVGYDTARRNSHRNLLRVLRDDTEARAVFRQPLGVRSGSAQVIGRARPRNELADWWTDGAIPMRAVVLGEEGIGKTWAVFDWLADFLKGNEMPLVLSFAAVAEDLSNPDGIEQLLARLLERWAGMLDADGWKRRLRRWLRRQPGPKPLIFLLVDGLGERARVDWRSFFAVLESSHWRETIAVLATDRPYHWNKTALSGVATFRRIDLAGYSDSELDRALASSSISKSDIPQDLIPLISTPRYCRIVLNHYAEMVAAADFTRERLIYLEIKDRYASRVGYPITDGDLFHVIRDLAEHAGGNAALRPKDLRAFISVTGGDDPAIYQEIISSGIVVPTTDGMTESLRVDPLRLVFGFGMLLADELARRFPGDATEDEVEHFLAFWFEPQPHMDRKVDICGSTLFHALIRQSFPEMAFRGLLRYWLGLRNWADTAQSAFSNYVVRRPGAFVAVAESVWSSAHDNGAAQEFLATGFVGNRDHPALQPLLVDAVERWMGFIHPLGRRPWRFDAHRNGSMRDAVAAHTGVPVVSNENEAAEEQSFRERSETRAGASLLPGIIEVAGRRLTVVDDPLLLRLGRLGLLLVSAGQRTPFLGSFLNWAVASSVMDESGFGDLVSWVIRLSDEDIESVLIAEALNLIDRKEEVASDAARILLVAIGSGRASSLVEELNLVPEWYLQRKREHAADPCKSFYRWSRADCQSCFQRVDVALHIILQRCELRILDPAVSIPESLVNRAKETLWSIDPTKIRAHLSMTVEAHTLEIITPILCAHAPTDLAKFLRSVVRTFSDRNPKTQYPLAVHLPKLSLLLKAEEISTISTVLRALSVHAGDWSEQDADARQGERTVEFGAFNALAPHLSPWKLLRELVARPQKALVSSDVELWFAPLERGDAAAAIGLLQGTEDRTRLLRLLWALPHLNIPLSEQEYTRLVGLYESGDSSVRAMIMRLPVISEDFSFGPRLIATVLAASGPMENWEELWRTRLIGRFSAEMAFEDTAIALAAPSASFVVADRGCRAEDLKIYADCLSAEWQRIGLAQSPESVELPEVTIKSDGTAADAAFPNFYKRPADVIRIGESWMSRPAGNLGSELARLFSTDVEAMTRKSNEDLRRKVKAILSAWKTDAFSWYARPFSPETIDCLYQRFPDMVEEWITPALQDTSAASAMRARFATLLEPICRVLLSRNSQTGLKLWELLRADRNSPAVIDYADIAFTADDNTASRTARGRLLDGCWSDEAIAQVAFACEGAGRIDWRNKTIEDALTAVQAWRRVKGLTLASFSDLTPDEFQALVARANVTGRWLEESLRELGETVRRNCIARHFFFRFLEVESKDEAWAALHISLLLADERLIKWRSDAQAMRTEPQVVTRLRFLDLWARGRNLEREICRESKRRKTFLGLEIVSGEIVPFT